MATTEPIRDAKDVSAMLGYYAERKEYRNHCLLGFGFYTGLRISDILKTKWEDVFDFELNKFNARLSLIEKKTGKSQKLFINGKLEKMLGVYKARLTENGRSPLPGSFLFKSRKGENRPITATQAYRITCAAAKGAGIDGVIGCHSLRKTLGYEASKNGASPAVIMEIYNHSSFHVTKRYLGINQDDRDEVYKSLNFE